MSAQSGFIYLDTGREHTGSSALKNKQTNQYILFIDNLSKRICKRGIDVPMYNKKKTWNLLQKRNKGNGLSKWQ